MIVHLVGPGGAGKSTTAPVLARKLGFAHLDLDQEYLKESQIDRDVEEHGYDYYVRRNIDLYLRLTASNDNVVVATSSGFMTYKHELHPAIAEIQGKILCSNSTVLLLPSFDLASCAQETINRLMSRPYESKSVEFQRRRIEKRFPIYRPIGTIQVSTDNPVDDVATEIQCALGFTYSAHSL